MTEVKSIINSRPLIVVKLMPLPPRNLLTMKTNVGMPPPVEFSRPNLYSEKEDGIVCNILQILEQMEKRISPDLPTSI